MCVMESMMMYNSVTTPWGKTSTEQINIVYELGKYAC